jgi:hypothetical protein
MNKEQITSLIRHLLSIVGGFLLMKGITDSVTIEAGSGVLLGLISLYWSIREKTATSDMVAGVIRQTLSFAGGFLVNWLNLSLTEWQFWVATVISLVPYLFKPGNLDSGK